MGLLFQNGMMHRQFLKKKKKANGVGSDETAHKESSHLNVHCLQAYLPVCRVERVKLAEYLG